MPVQEILSCLGCSSRPSTKYYFPHRTLFHFFCPHRVPVHTEWRLPIYNVHPIMIEKSALAGEGGGCTATPFQPITITYKVAVYAPAERTDTLPLFHLYPICTYSVFVPIAQQGRQSVMLGRLFVNMCLVVTITSSQQMFLQKEGLSQP